MKAHDLIHSGLYLIGENQVARFNALNGGFYTFDDDGGFIGNPFADVHSREIECFTINKKWLKISPIPITAEILEKNGWKWNNPRGEYVSSTFSLEWDFDLHEAWLRIGGEFTTITYVHELQHALRLCGFHDLADNFKSLED